MRNLSEANISEAVIAAMTGAQDARFKTILSRLVKHLHTFIQEVELTEAEWAAGIQFLTAVGQKCDEKRQEFILLSDVLGVTTMKDLVNNRKPPGVTEYTILGPFYRSDAPELPLFASIAGDLSGDATLIRGRVLSPDGSPIAGARVEVWQSDGEGFYDLQMPDVQGTVLRGIFHTGSNGQYAFRTIKPSCYPIPSDGPVGQMLAAMRRGTYRPAHIHFMISAGGYKSVTTELFPDGDPYLDSDAVFGVRESLVIPFVECTSEEDAARLGMPLPFFLVDYDFVLESA